MIVEFFVTKEAEASCDMNQKFAKFLRKAKRGKLAYSSEKGVLQRKLRISVEGILKDKSGLVSLSRGRGYIITKGYVIAKGYI